MTETNASARGAAGPLKGIRVFDATMFMAGPWATMLLGSLGAEVLHIEQGNDLEAVHRVLAQARASKSGKPKFVVARTLIGKGIPEVAGTQKAHGEGGAKFVDQARKNLGLPAEHFYVSEEVKQFFATRKEELAKRNIGLSITKRQNTK